jgi:hypothetical protein
VQRRPWYTQPSIRYCGIFFVLGAAMGQLSAPAWHEDFWTAVALWAACGLCVIVGTAFFIIYWRSQRPDSLD